MLFPTLASGVFLALLGAPSVLAIQDPPVNSLPELPIPIPSLPVLSSLGLRSDSPAYPRDDINPSDPSDSSDSDSLRPTRARPERPRRAPAPAAYEHINPTDLPTRTLVQADQIAPRARALTNAQRLANGLPPLAPRRRQRSRDAHPHAPRTSPKPCTNPTGTLTVTDVDTGAGVPFGQVGSMANAFGEYGLAGVEGGGALNVVLLQCNSEGAPFEVQTTNGLGNFTFFGGIIGFGSIDDNISDANSNYVYVGGTSEVSPGPAQDAPNGFTAATGTERDIESALWTLGADGSLTMNWINTDGTLAQGAHLLYVANANAIVLTGNVDLFRARFGPAAEVVLTFVADK
ncbi:hypothetical protein VTO73DRAFT_7576 [Trametes versicolor]